MKSFLVRTAKENQIAADYIRENFEAADRLALVLVKKSEGAVIQRLASAQAIVESDVQDWLREHNRRGYEVYLSMNALRPEATGRTKRDVQSIRHIYLDFDLDGTASLDRLLKRNDVPPPSYRVSSSPGRWHVIWKAERFSKEGAEHLQRELAWQTGADPAATDCARVLRLPGYYNHKHGKAHLVTAERMSTETYGPEHFPTFPAPEHLVGRSLEHGVHPRPHRKAAELSQSERDWAYAKRALARGEPPGMVAAAIAQYRRFDKHDPKYYAELTVHKAAEAIQFESTRSGAAR